MFMRRAITLILVLLLSIAPCAMAEAPGGEDDDARAMVLDAMEIYAWFVMSPLQVDPNAPLLEGGLRPVLDEELGNAETMNALLARTFSEEIISSLWDWDAYQVIDGWLYGVEREDSLLTRPMDEMISDIAVEITSDEADRRVYTATVCYLNADEPVDLEFVSERINGQWVFTEFPFFW